MPHHLHSRSISRHIAASNPDEKPAWSLPTPPPSLSELSSLTYPESPPGGISVLDDASERTHKPDHSVLLPLTYTRASRSAASSARIPAPGSRLSPAGAVAAWLILYLLCNLALTLHNKHLLSDFPFPWLLTALHAFCAGLGSALCAWRGVFKPAPLDHPTTPLLALFSVLYSANIAASNVSLRLVSIATHQVVRAGTPLFVILFAWIGRVGLAGSEPGLGSRTGYAKQVACLGVSVAKLKSLTPVILGVVFATYGDYSYTRTGLALTLLGAALAALKTMLASRVVHAGAQVHPSQRIPPKRSIDVERLKHPADEGYMSEHNSEDERTDASAPATLHPLDVLLRLSPLACVQCLITAHLTGETNRWATDVELGWRWRVLAVNGALAFVLNYASFVASRRAGPLSMTVAANVKQVLTILLSLFIFNTSVPPSTMHLLGIGLTLSGGVWYGLVEVRERKERART